MATPNEQAVLARFTGWGSMPGAFNDISPDAGQWTKERDEIRELLTESEWISAADSTLNAHYTSQRVVDVVWRAVQRIGFRGGRVLEPSMGIGNFFGLMPTALRGSTHRTGVELDSLTARMAAHLYPKSSVLSQGFETFSAPDGSFDLVVGNVPFGDYRLHDPRYSDLSLNIHDYFIVKSLDLVRPGGIVAVITSTGTMDKANDRARRAIAERADLVAAVRLPSAMFRATAGTDVVADLLIFQRRQPFEGRSGPAFLGLRDVPDPLGGEAMAVNEYWVTHPEHVMGVMQRSGKLYRGQSLAVVAPENLDDLLRTAVDSLPEGIMKDGDQRTAGELRDEADAFVTAMGMKEGTITLRGGDFVQAMEGGLYPYELPEVPEAREKLTAYLDVRDAVLEVVATQAQGRETAERDAARAKLNEVYDAFVARFGRLNDAKRRPYLAFQDDADAYLVRAIEEMSGGEWVKTPFFREDTITGYRRPTSAADAGEALGIALNETARVDLDRIAELLGITPDEAAARLVDEKLAFENPVDGWQSAQQYLSGNVKAKLLEARRAAETNPAFAPNVAALEAVQPPDVTADRIAARLGQSWIEPRHIADFAAFLTEGSPRDFNITYLPSISRWEVSLTRSGHRNLSGSAAMDAIWGTQDLSFDSLLELALNKQPAVVYDRNPDGTRTVNREKSIAAQQKITEIEREFGEWIFSEDERRAELVQIYNDTFNNAVAPTYDGSHLTFPGMNPLVTGILRPHQRSAIWRGIIEGRTLLAHEVGTGKTFIMVAQAIEMKRMGLTRLPVIATLKAAVPTVAAQARAMYPAAKILVLNQFTVKNRRADTARIATGNWDLIIMSHETLDKMPMGPEVMADFINRELEDLQTALTDAENSALNPEKSRTVKQLRKARLRRTERLQALLEQERDDVINFEETGIDYLFVDEAHQFKSLPIFSAHSDIKGVPGSDGAKRATALYARVRWLQERQGWRGATFATGTPVANSMAELYVMQRYLQGDVLEAAGVDSFDRWMANFAVPTEEIEFTERQTFKFVTRLSEWINMNELRRLFRQVVDVVRAEDLPGFTRPRRVDHSVAIPPNERQLAYIDEIITRGYKNEGKRPGEPGDNTLAVLGDGRDSALDARRTDPDATYDDQSKVGHVVRNVLEIHAERPHVTQLIFSDRGVQPTPWGFSVYDDIIDRLVAGGIPRDRIIDFRSLSERDRERASDRLQSGDALVGIGSSTKMGTGINAQRHLYAMHHLDAPWIPAHLEQRIGRGWRQGNDNEQVHNYFYATLRTLDTKFWQIVNRKQQFINKVLYSSDDVEAFRDEDPDQISWAEMMAIAADNPLLLERVRLDRDIAQLQALEQAHRKQDVALRDKVSAARAGMRRMEENIRRLEDIRSAVEAERDRVAGLPRDDPQRFTIEIEGKTYHSREAAQAALADWDRRDRDLIRAGKAPPADEFPLVGVYKGLKLFRAWRPRGEGMDMVPPLFAGLHPRGGFSYPAHARLESLDAVITVQRFDGEIEKQRGDLERLGREIEQSTALIGKPFPRADDLEQMQSRLKEIIASLEERQSNEKQRRLHMETPIKTKAMRYRSSAEAGGLDMGVWSADLTPGLKRPLTPAKLVTRIKNRRGTQAADLAALAINHGWLVDPAAGGVLVTSEQLTRFRRALTNKARTSRTDLYSGFIEAAQGELDRGEVQLLGPPVGAIALEGGRIWFGLASESASGPVVPAETWVMLRTIHPAGTPVLLDERRAVYYVVDGRVVGVLPVKSDVMAPPPGEIGGEPPADPGPLSDSEPRLHGDPPESPAMFADRVARGERPRPPRFPRKKTLASLPIDGLENIPLADRDGAREAQIVAAIDKVPQEILRMLAETNETRVLYGRFRHRARGMFKPARGIIRLRRDHIAHLSTLVHEKGHDLDDQIGLHGLRDRDPRFDKELYRLGLHHYRRVFAWSNGRTPSRRELEQMVRNKTTGEIISEGVADFFLLRFVDPAEAARLAPQYALEWESRMRDLAPHALAKLEEARDAWLLWEEQSPWSRIRSRRVSVLTGRPHERRMMSSLDQAYTDLVNRWHPIAVAENILTGGRRNKLSAAESALKQVQLLEGVVSRVSMFLMSATLDARLPTDAQGHLIGKGQSLLNILAPVADEMEDFKDYLVARGSLFDARMGRDTGYRIEDLEAVVREGNARPTFVAAWNGLQTFQREVLTYAVDLGFVDPAAAKRMWKFYGVGADGEGEYIPLRRLMELGLDESSAEKPPEWLASGDRIAAIPAPGSLRARRGSVRPVIDPIETIVMNTHDLIMAAERNRAMNTLLDLFEKPESRETGRRLGIDVVPRPMRKVRVNRAALQRFLLKNGLVAEGMNFDDIYTFVQETPLKIASDNVIQVRRGGKPVMVQLPRELYVTVQALDHTDLGNVVRMLSYPAQWLRAGAVLANPFHWLRNVIRDSVTAALIGKTMPIYHSVLGAVHVLRNDELMQTFRAAGADFANLLAFDKRALVEQTLARAMSGRHPSTGERIRGFVHHPMLALRRVMAASESATRVAEFQAMLREGLREGLSGRALLEEAAFHARDLLDFARHGANPAVRALNLMTAFFNANLQGLDKVVRAGRLHRVPGMAWDLVRMRWPDPEDSQAFGRFALRAATFVTLPSLLLYLLQNRDDEEYWERPDYERDYFWHVRMGRGWILVPKPFELGLVFGTIPERIWRYTDVRDRSVIDSLISGEMLMSFGPRMVPTWAVPVIEHFANRSLFFRRPLFSNHLDVPGVPGWRQATWATSETAHAIAWPLNASPAVIDNYIQGYTGWLGRAATAAIDIGIVAARGDGRETAERARESARRVLLDPVYRSPER